MVKYKSQLNFKVDILRMYEFITNHLFGSYHSL